MKLLTIAALFILPGFAGVSQNKQVAGVFSTQQQLQQLNRKSHGLLGVKALCIETGQQIGFHSDHSFPMASTYKVPIGICFLSQVHRGMHRLSDSVIIHNQDLRPGHSPLAQKVLQTGALRLSKLQLLAAMVHESDNTACDKILDLIGGPTVVNDYITKLGITGMRIDRPEALLTTHSVGLYSLLPGQGWSLARFESLADAVPEAERITALRNFMQDLRDTTTPEAMTRLLTLLHCRQLNSFSEYALFADLLTDPTTGQHRLQGLLPKGATLRHKPGTAVTAGNVNAGTNDVGIITTPDGKRHILIAVFLKGSSLDDKARDQIIAQTARVVYDAFVR